jgi:hypothetical protein
VLRDFVGAVCRNVRDATAPIVTHDPETATALSREIDDAARRIEARIAELVPSLQ